MEKEELRKLFYLRVFRKIVYGDPLNQSDRNIFKEWKRYYNPPMHLFEHYRNKEILFEIVKYLKNNELCLNENIRWLYASKVDYLFYIFYFYKVLEHRGKNKKGEPTEGLTFYKGLIDFNKREQPPFNPQEKSKWQKDIWTEKAMYRKLAIGYNFGLDIDGKDFMSSYKDAKKVFDFLTNFKIKFSVWCSGKKGFHFIIPYEEFEEIVKPFNLNKTIAFCKGLMLDLVKHLKLKKVDKLIYSPTRYLKCPFTIDMRNGRVILPLSDEEFLSFPKHFNNYTSSNYCMKIENLGNLGAYRGRNTNPPGFLQMLNYLDRRV